MIHASYSIDGVIGVLSCYDSKWLVNHMKEMITFFGSRMVLGRITNNLEEAKGETGSVK